MANAQVASVLSYFLTKALRAVCNQHLNMG